MAHRSNIHSLRIHLALACAFFLPTNALPQSADQLGLILKGRGSSSTGSCKDVRTEQECRRFRMTFVNTGREPVIILNPTLGFGSGIRAMTTYAQTKDRLTGAWGEIELDRRSVVPDPEQLDNLRSLLPLLDTERPAENLTVIIRPGDDFAFEEMFVVERSKKWMFDNEEQVFQFYASHPSVIVNHSCSMGKTLRGCSIYPTLIKLAYEFRLPATVDDPDLLDRIAHRWRRYGRLPLDDSGGYSFTSEFIKQ